MNLLLLADTEAPLPSAKDVHVILTLGDLDLGYLRKLPVQYPGTPILSVLGNHDTYELEAPFVTMHAAYGELEGVTFAGLNGCLPYKDTQKYGYYDEEITEILQQYPTVDVVLSHNSPKGIHDSKADMAHEGYAGLLEYIQKHKPRYVFHGHQHKDITTKVGETLVIGVYGAKIINIGKTHKGPAVMPGFDKY